MTRTAIIFESDIDYMRLFVVDGDWSHLDRRCIGLFSLIECDVEPETVLIDADRKLENFMYDEQGRFRLTPATRDEFVEAIRDGALLIYCAEAG